MPKTTPKRPRRNRIAIRGTEAHYASQLRKIAGHVGDVINGFPAGDPSVVPTIATVLEKYSDALTGWAKSTAGRVIAEVAKRDEKAWMTAAENLSRALRDELRHAPTGVAMRALLDEQVGLIKSIPLDAAKRVHRLTLEGIENSTRASEIAKEIMRSGDVAKSRATLIARTETGRTATTLTQARAQHIGSDGYIWRTSKDSDVRPSHKRMEGKFVRWDDPPTLDGLTGHAGALPNCRCYPEPVIPE